MFSDYLIGNYKFVLFIDDLGIERNSKVILEKLLNEQNLSYEYYSDETNEILEKKYIIIESLTKLEQKYNEKEIFRNIQRLKFNENVIQLFAWISSKNVQSKILIPFLEHMSNAIVNINDSQHMTIVTKNKSGVVKFKEFNHELAYGRTSIKEYKKEHKQQAVPETNEDIGTFKIGQKADELEAKRNLKLPFELIDLPSSNTKEKQQGKIIYTPDNVDDFDEEDDPDNDLQF